MSEPRPRRLGPGTIALIVLGLEDLRLRVAPGGWSGDLLEWLFFGRKEFQLRWAEWAFPRSDLTPE